MALLLVASKVLTGYPDSVVLESGQIIIGRLQTNHLVLASGNIDPIHAMIETDPDTGQTTVVDMASEVGVMLNGRRIDVSANIKVGDKITVGDVTIDVQQATDSAAAKNDFKESGGDTRVDLNRQQQQPRVVNSRLLFTAEKDRRTGSTLEVVAFWDQSILDVRHYGGEQLQGDEPRSNKVVLGNEHEGDLIGVGPKANTRKLTLADVRGSKAVVFLNDEMRARVRRGARFEQIKGPSEVQLSANDMALVQHGTISYFMTRVAVPNPILRKIEELDGKPIIFMYASFLYLLLALVIGVANTTNPPKEADDQAWSTVFTIQTPTPKPTNKAEPPAPKPTVVIKTPPPEKKSTPTPDKPKPTQPPRVVATPAPAVNTNVQRPNPKPESPAKNQGPVTGEKPKTKDPFLGPKNNATNAGNGGGPRGGTSGAFAGQRQGNDKASMMGVEGGKKDELGGLNLDALGADIGKTINAEGAGKIAIGVKANGGGLGGGSGSGKRGSFGMGGIGEGNSISSGGPGSALNGLGAGGFGAGGNGAGGARDSGGGGKIRVGAVSMPSGDSVLEGNLSKAEIEAVIKANLAKIKACYERQLQAKRGLQGRVMSRFVISPEGRVTSAEITQSDLRDGPTESCIANEIRRWKFPLPRGGGQVNVSYPFVFTPSS